jgi:hypothetical protein
MAAASAALRPCTDASTIPGPPQPQPHPIPRSPCDLDQALRPGRFQRPDEHVRLSCHHHLHRQRPRPGHGGSRRRDYSANLPCRGTTPRSRRAQGRSAIGVVRSTTTPCTLRHPVGDLGADGQDEAFGEAVRPRTPRRDPATAATRRRSSRSARGTDHRWSAAGAAFWDPTGLAASASAPIPKVTPPQQGSRHRHALPRQLVGAALSRRLG